MSALSKVWLALVRDSGWTMALLQRSLSGTEIKAFREFDVSSFDVSSHDADVDFSLIRNWMRLHDAGSGPAQVKMVLEGSGVMACLVELPRVSTKTLDRHFKDNVSDYFDCDEDTLDQGYIVNFKIVSFFEENGHDRIRILLAALPKKRLTMIYDIAGQLDMDLVSINIACECYMRLLERTIPGRFFDIAYMDVSHESAHIFLIEKGKIVRYSGVQAELNQLLQALRQCDMPEREPTGIPLKNLMPQSLGFESAERLASSREAGPYGDFSDGFPEVDVVTPRIEEPALESLFVERKDLPFLLTITARDLRRKRERDAQKQLEWSHEDLSDMLFHDGDNAAALECVFEELKGLIREQEPSFEALYVTGFGEKESGFSFELKKAWQDLLPVRLGFVEGWKPPVTLPGMRDGWTNHACLLGLMLKAMDDME